MAPFTVIRGDLEYEVTSIEVGFANPNDPEDPTWNPTTPSFAKRVTVNVANPYFYLGDDPTAVLPFEMSRVFVYGCATDDDFLPQPFPNECCPGDTPGTGTNNDSGIACPATTPPLPPPCSISP